MTTTRTAARLRNLAATYAANTWPTLAFRKPTAAEVVTMEIRADGYADAHVEGEHEANGLCSFTSARECGLHGAASEFVETTDFSTEGVTAQPAVTRAAGSHADHDHPATKAARAACRRSQP